MNFEDALQILDIDPTFKDKNEFNEIIKKKYRLKALILHPDKNKSHNACEEFQKVNEAYHYLMNNKPSQDFSFYDLLFEFLKYTFDIKNDKVCHWLTKFIIDHIENIYDSSLYPIFNNSENKNEKFIHLYDFLSKYKINNIYKSFKEYIHKPKKEVVLNPKISDIFEDNVFKLSWEDKEYIIPLWHNELVYDNESYDLVINIIPEMDSNVSIDENNNIIIKLNEKITNIWDNDEIIFYIGSREFSFSKSLVKLLKKQYISLFNQGISKINTNNIYDVSKKSNIIILLELEI